MKTILKKVKKSAISFLLFAFAFGSFGLSTNQIAHATTTWDTTGTYVINVNHLGTDYPHDMSLVQDGSDNLTGNGGSPAGANTYTWVITSGSVVNNTIDFLADYTATPDAVTPQTTMHVLATIEDDGEITGTWSDNYGGGERSGTISTVSGAAVASSSSEHIQAEDFGVMNESGVKGYTAGFGLIDEDLSDIESAVVKLYSGTTLLQTNTSTNLSGLPGSQFSSPFDVFGTFNYATDGFWTNVRESEYGQNLIPTKVIATVTLEDDEVLIAQNNNLTGDPSTIMETPNTSKVTILKYVDGVMATAVSANNSDFPMNATYVINGTPGTGQYALSETGYNGDTTPYQAVTSDLPNGSDYSTSEATSLETPGTSCAVAGTDYALVGYTYGNTLAQAQAATSSLVAPSFVNIQTDKFVIVLNDDCSTVGVGGEIIGEVTPGNGVLEVTSIEMTDSSATANNSFEDGWEYVFNITVPTNETDVSMKFANWLRTGGSEIIPAANNMRISSPQANNGGATISILGADTYSTPPLTMVTDLNPSLDGIQVKITVEVKVPTGTTNGSYTTTYGVKSE